MAHQLENHQIGAGHPAHHHVHTPELKDKAVYGVVAEFDDPAVMVDAGHELHHTHGYKHIDALSPFPIHGIDAAIGTPKSKLGYIVAACGVFGLLNAIFMIWYIGAVDYPLVIGGKPLFAFEFSVPVMFELTVLLSAFGAVIGMLALNGLPRFYHPVMNYSNFPSVTNDRFLLVVDAGDAHFDVEQTPALLRHLGARNVEVVEQ
jgi:hypothetical protein